MHIHPAISALRERKLLQRPPGSQKGAWSEVGECSAALKAVRDDWLALPLVHTIADELARYGEGVSLEDCPALSGCLGNHDLAIALIDPMVKDTLGTLTAHPLGEAPFRFKVSRGLATIQLMQAKGATLSLAAYEPLSGTDAPDSVLFSDREVREIVVRGHGTGVVHSRLDEGNLTTDRHAWGAGDTIALRAREQARQILKVESSLLILQLVREPKRAAPTRLVSLNSGETLRTASGDKSASQAVMALGVLGALGDRGALDLMEQTARNSAEDADVRWEAARQALGLDAKRGLAVLERLSRGADDPLAAPAKALSTHLLTAQPELRALVQEDAA